MGTIRLAILLALATAASAQYSPPSSSSSSGGGLGSVACGTATGSGTASASYTYPSGGNCVTLALAASGTTTLTFGAVPTGSGPWFVKAINTTPVTSTPLAIGGITVTNLCAIDSSSANAATWIQLEQTTSAGTFDGSNCTSVTASTISQYSIKYSNSPIGPDLGVAPNTAATDQVLTSTGTGSAAQAPTLKGAPALAGTNFTVIPTTALTTFSKGQIALATSPISSGACQTVTPGSVNSVAITSITTASSYGWAFSGSIKAVTGFVPGTSGALSVTSYVSAGYINWDVCNWSSGSITPGAVTLNYWVLTL